jgi:hypothetical protein
MVLVRSYAFNMYHIRHITDVICDLKRRESIAVVLEILLRLCIQHLIFLHNTALGMTTVSSHGTFDPTIWNRLINACCCGYCNMILCTGNVVLSI